MAHRYGLRVNHERPQPPDLLVSGRVIPKIRGEVDMF